MKFVGPRNKALKEFKGTPTKHLAFTLYICIVFSLPRWPLPLEKGMCKVRTLAEIDKEVGNSRSPYPFWSSKVT